MHVLVLQSSCLYRLPVACFTLIFFLMSYMVVSVMSILLTIPYVGLQCVIMVFPGHTQGIPLFKMHSKGKPVNGRN